MVLSAVTTFTAFFTGFLVSSLLYIILCTLFPVEGGVSIRESGWFEPVGGWEDDKWAVPATPDDVESGREDEKSLGSGGDDKKSATLDEDNKSPRQEITDQDRNGAQAVFDAGRLDKDAPLA